MSPTSTVGGNVQNVRCLTRPTQARQDAPFHGQGRSHFDARSVLIVRERERREERQVCEPEGSAKWRPAYAKPLRQAWNRWFVSRSFSEGWRLFSTFPFEQVGEEHVFLNIVKKAERKE